MKEFKLYIIIFFCALVFGIQMVRKNLFPYNYLKKRGMRKIYLQHPVILEINNFISNYK